MNAATTPPPAAPTPPSVRPYPVRLEAQPPEGLSPGLWLVKWLLLIPHVIVLMVLWLGYAVLWVVALFAVVITERFPRGIFEYQVGVLRWTWRVSYYGYSALGTDTYPPFTLAEVPDYPATLSVEYPGRLSRGRALVKWWLLAIPHYIVVGLLTGPQMQWRDGDGMVRYSTHIGLIGILVLVVGFTLLFVGRYPRGLHDLLMGLNRWAYRVGVYVSLMTDQYPPFRLDMGAKEPGLPSGNPAEGGGAG